MKTELQIIEELIEEKTKEYLQVNGKLMHALQNYKSDVSFGHVENVFGMQIDAERVEDELEELHAKRLELLGDFREEELIIGSKEAVRKRLEELPDGIYKLAKVEREDDGKE